MIKTLSEFKLCVCTSVVTMGIQMQEFCYYDAYEFCCSPLTLMMSSMVMNCENEDLVSGCEECIKEPFENYHLPAGVNKLLVHGVLVHAQPFEQDQVQAWCEQTLCSYITTFCRCMLLISFSFKLLHWSRLVSHMTRKYDKKIYLVSNTTIFGVWEPDRTFFILGPTKICRS